MTKNLPLIFLLASNLTACSVSNVKHPAISTAIPSDELPAPQQPSPITEITPEPILVTAPIPVSQTPVSTDLAPTTDIIGSLPQTSDAEEGLPTNPAVVIIDPTNIIEVTAPSSSSETDSEPSEVSANPNSAGSDGQSNGTLPSNIDDSSDSADRFPALDSQPQLEIPEPILTIVDELNSSPAQPVSSNDNAIPQIDNPTEPTHDPSLPDTPVDTSNQPISGDPDDDSYEEIIVKGSCLGKKNIGVILIDTRDAKNKKNKSIKCKSNEFLIKFLERKNEHPFFQVQTVFFD